MNTVPRRTVLAACGALVLSGCSVQEDSGGPPLGSAQPAEAWTMYRGNIAQTGFVETTLSGPYEHRPLWRFSNPIEVVDYRRSLSGVIATEDVLVATADDSTFQPCAVDRTDPDLLWRASSTHDPEFRLTSHPVAIGDSVFVASWTSTARFAATDGDVVWERELGLSRDSPFVGDRSVLHHPDFVSLDPETGDTQSPERIDARALGTAATDTHAIVGTRSADGRDGQVVGYDRDELTIEWTQEPEFPPREAPAIHDGYAVTLTKPARGRASRTIAYDPVDGTVLWERDIPGARRAPALDEDGTIYLPHQDDGVLALKAETGETRFRGNADDDLAALFDPQEKVYPPIVTNDAVVLSGSAGLVIFDRDDGTIRWKTELRLMGAPAVAFGNIYVITDEWIGELA